MEEDEGEDLLRRGWGAWSVEEVKEDEQEPPGWRLDEWKRMVGLRRGVGYSTRVVWSRGREEVLERRD